MEREYSRQALYEQVWAQPKTIVAKSLGISDVYLGKICRGLDIPVPPRGYWALLKAEKSPHRIPLPPRGLGKADSVHFGREQYWDFRKPIGDLPPLPCFPEPVDEVVRRARVQVGKVLVQKSLTSPHPLIAKLLEEDELRQKALAESPYSWNEPRFVAAPARRRLKLINTLFIALTRTGCSPWLRGKDANEIGVCVGDAQVSFKIEPLKKSRHHDHMFDKGNSERGQPLEISIGSRVEEIPGIADSWQDSKEDPIEPHIPEIVLRLVVAGEMPLMFL